MNCELCNRSENVVLDEHHFIPKTLHSNKWYKKNFTKEQLHSTILLCRDCHDAIHGFITEKELGKNYNTKEKLMLLFHAEIFALKILPVSKAHN